MFLRQMLWKTLKEIRIEFFFSGNQLTDLNEKI